MVLVARLAKLILAKRRDKPRRDAAQAINLYLIFIFFFPTQLRNMISESVSIQHIGRTQMRTMPTRRDLRNEQNEAYVQGSYVARNDGGCAGSDTGGLSTCIFGLGLSDAR